MVTLDFRLQVEMCPFCACTVKMRSITLNYGGIA